ncbi:MAG: hypothetical protein KC646_05785 [Candidatus Cloacimonetes bacterium]|nr:hypothetical protein [Candidatus Cloacimonadota bacterium]
MSEIQDKIIINAIDKDKVQDLKTSELISVAEELSLSPNQLNSSLAQVSSQVEILKINNSLTEVKESFIEFASFKSEGFSNVTHNPQQLESKNEFLRLSYKQPIPFLSMPYCDICLKQNSEGDTLISWKLNLEKYQESTFAYNSIMATILCIMAAMGVYQIIPFILINIGIVVWSRTLARDTFKQQISKDLQSLKIACELAKHSNKEIE